MDGATTHLRIAMIAIAGIAGACFVAYLLLLVFVIVRTGSTAGLRDVAAAISAYKMPLVSRARAGADDDDGG